MKKEKALKDKIDFDLLRNCSEKETAKTFTGLDSKKLLSTLVTEIPNNPTPLRQKIAYQIECLGYIDIVDKPGERKNHDTLRAKPPPKLIAHDSSGGEADG